MTNAEIYFHRNRGSWNWKTSFRVTDWELFWRSDLPFARKIAFTLFIFSQNLFGRPSLWTHVDYREGSDAIGHQTRLSQFGVTLMRSRKVFKLDPDGSGLVLTGCEYFWPCLWRAHAFDPLKGYVEASTTRARYQMPLFGSRCDCQALLAPEEGEVLVQTPWLSGQFVLTEESKKTLRARFREHVTQSPTYE